MAVRGKEVCDAMDFALSRIVQTLFLNGTSTDYN